MNSDDWKASDDYERVDSPSMKPSDWKAPGDCELHILNNGNSAKMVGARTNQWLLSDTVAEVEP